MCDETMFLFHLNKLLLYGIWRIRSIYTHIHSISFLIVCSFHLAHSFALARLLVCSFAPQFMFHRSFVRLHFFRSLILSRATLFALSHLIRFFSFHFISFSRAIQISFCYLPFFFLHIAFNLPFCASARFHSLPFSLFLLL